MLSGRVPFQTHRKHESASDVMRRIRNAEFSFEGPEWQQVSEDGKDLICGLLTVDPMERITIDELREHPWLQQNNTPNTPLVTPSVLESASDNVGKSKSKLFKFPWTISRKCLLPPFPVDKGQWFKGAVKSKYAF